MTIRELFERPTAARVATARYLLAADLHGRLAARATHRGNREDADVYQRAANCAIRAAQAELRGD